jgi:hypothetical protein
MISRLVVLVVVAILAPVSAGCTSCPTALAEGVLAAEGDTLVLRTSTGDTIRVVWPTGYRVQQDGGKRVLVDWLGSVKAREGDHVQAGGGFGADDRFHACGDIVVVPP